MQSAMVIDDDPGVRRTFVRMLRVLGFRVSQAVDGPSGMAQLAAEPNYDLVLVDWKMPGLSGLDVVERLRREDRYADTTIVMVTSLDDVVAVAAALVAGVQAYVTKPISARDLRERLEELGFLFDDGAS